MTKKRGFAVPPGMAGVVAGAKVTTAGDPPVVPPQGGETPATGETPMSPPPDAPPAPPAAPPAESPPEAPKTAPEPAPQAPAVKAKPWESASETPKGLNFQPDAALHAKMNWVCNNVPGGMSRLRILREGALMLCDALIAKHYKEEAE
jgi:outer membrane biosynthesis protein TonB